MVYSFTFLQEMIDSIQERIEVLERCLNDPKPQDEKMAEILELVNIQEISVIQLQEELLKLIEKFIRVRKISQVILEKSSNGEHFFNHLLLYVRQDFMYKEIIDSAIYQPQASFGGELLHPTIYKQAAAYLFHICKNHAFIDGNKRTVFDVMVTFLNLNDYELNLTPDEAYQLTM